MTLNPGLTLVTIAVVAVLVVHVVLARKGPVWAGAIIPALWVVAVAVLTANGEIKPGRPYVVCAAGLVMLLWLWGSEHQGRARRTGTPGRRVDAHPER